VEGWKVEQVAGLNQEKKTKIKSNKTKEKSVNKGWLALVQG